MEVLHTIKIDLAKMGVMPHLYFMQGDSARNIDIKLYENDVPWNVPIGTVGVLAFLRQDEKSFRVLTLKDGTPVVSFSKNIATINIPPEMTTLIGAMPVVVELIGKSGNQLGTFPIAVNVIANPYENGTDPEPVSPDQFTQLLSYISLEKARIDGLVAMKGASDTTINNFSNEDLSGVVVSNGVVAKVYVSFDKQFSLSGGSTKEFEALPVVFAPMVSTVLTSTTSTLIANGTISVILEIDQQSDNQSKISVTNNTNETVVVHKESCTATYPLLNVSISELEDIRVGNDGNKYPTAGEAVRGQVNNISPLIVTLDEETGKASSTTKEIYNRITAGGNVFVERYGFRYPVSMSSLAETDCVWIDKSQQTMLFITIDHNGNFDVFGGDYVNEDKLNYILGDISSALDEIRKYAENLINGGGSV